jgi:RNA polymerase sigma factor (sigma-70 family)
VTKGRLRQQDFERLFDEHSQSLFGFLVYRTGDRALAEDVLADTFERALRARARFDHRRGTEKSWLYAIALNRLRDRRRRAEAEERAMQLLETSFPVEDPNSSLEQFVVDRDQVHRMLGRLSAEEREAIALRYAGDLSLREIAKVTGERQTTIESRIYRSLRKLRDQLIAEAPSAAAT